MNRELLEGKIVSVIDHFLPGKDCDRLVARSEALASEAATSGEVPVTEPRYNSRMSSTTLK